MRISIKECPCKNPNPHRKLVVWIGNIGVFETDGFFTVRQGKWLLNRILATSDIEQTSTEKEATIREIEASGLEPGEFTEELLANFAEGLKKFPEDKHAKMVELAVLDGDFSQDEGQKILTLAGH